MIVVLFFVQLLLFAGPWPSRPLAMDRQLVVAYEAGSGLLSVAACNLQAYLVETVGSDTGRS